MEKRTRILQGILLGTIAATVLVVVLTIAGDMYKPLKTFLKEAHHHHWVGKGVWAALLFAIVSVFYAVGVKGGTDERTSKLLRIASWTILAGTVLLILFFVWEYFRHM